MSGVKIVEWCKDENVLGESHASCPDQPAFRRRVSQPFLAAAERSERFCAAFLPPREDETWVSFLPRPEPDLLPPPDSLLTVAHARLLASFTDTPRSS